jgi:hypothetical protein
LHRLKGGETVIEQGDGVKAHAISWIKLTISCAVIKAHLFKAQTKRRAHHKKGCREVCAPLASSLLIAQRSGKALALIRGSIVSDQEPYVEGKLTSAVWSEYALLTALTREAE